MSLNFKSRIAFHYMIATAVITAFAFGVIYLVVQETVLTNLDNDLSYEARKHTREITIREDSILFRNKAEWEEREHREVQVNPVFIQLVDKRGRLMDKSPNLKDDVLSFEGDGPDSHFDSRLGDKAIRQVHVPIRQDGAVEGYILAAMSSESARSILMNLKHVLAGAYTLVLIGLFFISRLLAGRSIRPVQEVTKTINRITKHNVKERVALPPHEDEIHDLATGFNALLDRIENALERERQFTSDASHELRTPLATLRGTLEVLIRKPRSQQEYEEKVSFSLAEIEKMANTLEQLLLLARLDSSTVVNEEAPIELPTLLDDSLGRFRNQIAEKNLNVKLHFDPAQPLLVPHYYTSLIIDNILSNAIKYSPEEATLEITAAEENSHVVCTIRDEGIGIETSDLKHIYDSFFRSDSLNHKQISGTGLGLSIVKKCADAIGARLQVESSLGKGTTVTIIF